MKRADPVTCMILAGFAAVMSAQTDAHIKRSLGNQDVYEDDEVRMTIPAGWTRASGNYPSLQPTSGMGNAVLQAQTKLLLQKDGYTLALAFRTGHASGADGGRFIEAFEIPWLTTDDAWTCSLSLTYIPQPVSRTLLFQNMVFQTGLPKLRALCGIPKDLSEQVGEGLQRRFIGERRWYGGYFTDRGFPGGYFFDESSGTCESKVYSLTTSAKTPAQLPAAGDPHLEQIIREAIDIVNSIHYKRCAPKLSSLPLPQ